MKLRTEQRYDPTLSVAPVGATTPANDGFVDYKNTDYVGNIIYETEKKGTTITSKTKILVDGGYIENNVYHYYLTDHLGNNRVVANASGTVIQKNHYYPFGTAFADKYDNGTNQPYKYNGKELDQMHGLNLYDYSARYYESAIGRFTTVDPLAEKYYSISPYAYCNNNPMRFIDPTGKEGIIPSLLNKATDTAKRYVVEKVTHAAKTLIKETKSYISKNVSPYFEFEGKMVAGPRVAGNVKGTGFDLGYKYQETSLTLEFDKSGLSNAEVHGRKLPTEKYTSGAKLGVPVPIVPGWAVGVEGGAKTEIVVNKENGQVLSNTSEQSFAVTPYAAVPIALEYKNSNTTDYSTNTSGDNTNTKKVGISTGVTGVLFIGFEINISFGLKLDNER